MTNIRFIYV